MSLVSLLQRKVGEYSLVNDIIKMKEQLELKDHKKMFKLTLDLIKEKNFNLKRISKYNKYNDASFVILADNEYKGKKLFCNIYFRGDKTLFGLHKIHYDNIKYNRPNYYTFSQKQLNYFNSILKNKGKH